MRELLRTPIVVGRTLAGADLRHDSLSYVFERTTGDDPFRRNPYGTDTVLNDPLDRGDAEAQIVRAVFAPATRSYSLAAWVYPAVATADSTLDRLAGYAGKTKFDSSARFQDQPAYRASSAFGPAGGPGWVGVWQRPEAPPPWLAWSTPHPLRVSRLNIAPSSLMVRRPTVVQLSWPGGTSPALPVASDGAVVLPQAVQARSFRLTILDATFPAGASQRDRQANSVGIGSLSVPGLRPVRMPTAGRLHAGCGTVKVVVSGRTTALQVNGTVAELDAGTPLRAVACATRPSASAQALMPAGIQVISSLPGPFSVDLLRLSSPAPAPVTGPSAADRVIEPGTIGNSSVTGVRVSLSRPSWLVLGESFDTGWRGELRRARARRPAGGRRLRQRLARPGGM